MSREEVRRALCEQGGGIVVNDYPTPDWRRIVTDVVSFDGMPWRVVADDLPDNTYGPEGWIILDWRPL